MGELASPLKALSDLFFVSESERSDGLRPIGLLRRAPLRIARSTLIP